MASKNFCDRCGKEIKPRTLFRPNGKSYDVALDYKLRRWGWGRKQWELCHDCAKAIRVFLNSPDEDNLGAPEDIEESE